MRAFALAIVIALLPSAAPAYVGESCYTACAEKTTSNQEYKACLARVAEAADAKLNEAYAELKAGIRRSAAELGQKPDDKLQSLVSAQKEWIAYRDTNCRFEDELAFGGTAIGGNYSACLCALSLERVGDFARIRKHVLFGE